MSVPKAEAFNLMGEDNSVEETSSEKVLHWKKRVIWSVMSEDIALNTQELPPEIFPYIKKRVDQETRSYLPIVMVDHLSSRLSDLERMKLNAVELPLTIVYQPLSAGKLKLWTHFELAFKQLGGYGFGEKEIDEVKGILVDTNIYFLLLTFIISALHILFDTLAFKNDISYWRKRENMVGLSTRVVMWRCVSTIIIFFYLLDSETSLLVLVPTGISALIEIWKLKKALKITLSWSRNPVTFGSISDKEKETEQFDATAMKYLSYALYPLVACGAIYSLIYTPHKSWYSWCLQSLVNGVYAFGFLFMLPQLFVNYKLKSVAHLPWRAFMYKAFNTFIDDVFAFIITMPTAHRVACFRDDLVFLVYLYQRWLYPVDKTRVNEFGQSFDGEGDSMSIGSKQKSE
ncbi:CLPTM1L [Bugula neritina]|uniref:Lipid scramblase CLPTM1L n=1 Tax=Bugula neritina TaxID=10212 RepID=A0A7J7K1E8_BUGNE|nr:CLPTM1L [Bugula neritina]